MAEPIDYIDLTADSPRNTVLRQQIKNSENKSSRHGKQTRSRKRNVTKPQGAQLDETVNLEESANNVNFNEDSNRNMNPVEIIDLDETMVSEHKRSYLNSSVKGRNISLKCPICFEELTSEMKPTSTQCGHIFCAQCLEQATAHKIKKCPKCRSSIKLKSCTRLYLDSCT